MPEIDVTDVLISSDVAATAFSVIRRKSMTGTNGIEVHTNQVISPVYGSVTPTGDNSLVREAAFQNQNKTIMVVTPFLLRGATTNPDNSQWQPDLILWQRDYFIVKSVEDYSQFGVGMIAADCELFDYVPESPSGNKPVTGKLDFSVRRGSMLGGAH